MSTASPDKARRVTPPALKARKASRGQGERIVCLTAYSAPMARLLDPHVDVLLVGDSLAMVEYGERSTLNAGLERMMAHGRAVAGAASHALVAVDMPFGSFEAGPAEAFASAAQVLAQTGAQAVKLEGGGAMAETVAFLTARGIPVIGHVGLMPQSVNALGGFKARGGDEAERQSIINDARHIDDAGAFMLVVEGVREDVAVAVTDAVSVPVIGIGASAHCDGQILVAEDMLGLTDTPARFVRRYSDLATMIGEAAARYAEDVRTQAFPGEGEVYAPRQRT